MLPPTWPKPTSVPTPEVSHWPGEALPLRTGVSQPLIHPVMPLRGKKGPPACPGHSSQLTHWRELRWRRRGETFPESPWGAPLSVERDHGVCGLGLWIIDFRKSWWTQAGPMREELQWLRAWPIKSGTVGVTWHSYLNASFPTKGPPSQHQENITLITNNCLCLWNT